MPRPRRSVSGETYACAGTLPRATEWGMQEQPWVGAVVPSAPMPRHATTYGRSRIASRRRAAALTGGTRESPARRRLQHAAHVHGIAGSALSVGRALPRQLLVLCELVHARVRAATGASTDED